MTQSAFILKALVMEILGMNHKGTKNTKCTKKFFTDFFFLCVPLCLCAFVVHPLAQPPACDCSTR
jgi:hypothetical protein